MDTTLTEDRGQLESRRTDLQTEYFASRAERDRLVGAIRAKKDEIAEITATAREELEELKRQQEAAIATTKEVWRQYREADRAVQNLPKAKKQKRFQFDTRDPEFAAEQVRRGFGPREDLPEEIRAEVEALLEDRPVREGFGRVETETVASY